MLFGRLIDFGGKYIMVTLVWPNFGAQNFGAKIFLEKNMELNNLIKEIYILSKKK